MGTTVIWPHITVLEACLADDAKLNNEYNHCNRSPINVIAQFLRFIIKYLQVITSILPKRKHQNCKTLITRYQPSHELHDVTSAQLSIVFWKMWASSEERCVGVSETKTKRRFHSSCYSNISISLVSVWDVNLVLFNSMLRYVINR